MKPKSARQIFLEVVRSYVSVALPLLGLVAVAVLYKMGEVTQFESVLWLIVIATIAWFGRGR